MTGIAKATSDYLLDVAAIAASVANEVAGIADTAAAAIGEETALRIARDHGGQLIYIKQNARLVIERFEEKAVAAFTRNRYDHGATARELGISVGYLYAVLKRQHEREKAERQGKLTLD